MNLRSIRRVLPIRSRLLPGAVALVVVALAGQLVSVPVLLAQPANGTPFKPPQEIDGSGSPAKPRAQNTNPPVNPVSRQQLFDQLVKEMDNLIPGELEDGSTRKRAVEDAITAFQLRDGKRVMEIFNKQAEVDTDFPPTQLLLAGLSFAVKDAEFGRILLERTGIEHPDSPAIYAAFSRLAINEGRFVDAFALLERMKLILDQGNHKLSEAGKKFYELQLLDGMTDVAMRQHRFEDARAFLAKQRESNPNNAKVLMVSAELEFKEKKLDNSIKYLNQLRESFPNTRAPETIIASWFQRSGQPAEAKKWLSDAAAKYEDDAQVQIELASWAVNEEDFPTASASIKKAEAAGKESPLSKSLKAKIAFAGQSYLVAESHYEALSKMQPDNFDFANMYALCLIESKDEAKRLKARDIASQNFRSLPKNVVAQAALGYVQLRLGELEQAKSVLGRALQTKGISGEIEFFGASLLREMKEPAKAKQVLESALGRKGLFLYRMPARKMLTELNAQAPTTPADK
jgi:Tfp pilus assembly protein PilF